MIVIWLGVTLVFGVSFHVALKTTKIELNLNQQLYVIVLASLTALIPAVGPYLAFLAAVLLTYRSADAGFGNVLGAMALTWLIAFLALLLTIGLIRVLMTIGPSTT